MESELPYNYYFFVFFAIPNINRVFYLVTSSSIDAILKRLKPPVNSDVPYNLDKPKKLWFSQYQQDQLVAKAFRKKVSVTACEDT